MRYKPPWRLQSAFLEELQHLHIGGTKSKMVWWQEKSVAHLKRVAYDPGTENDQRTAPASSSSPFWLCKSMQHKVETTIVLQFDEHPCRRCRMSCADYIVPSTPLSEDLLISVMVTAPSDLFTSAFDIASLFNCALWYNQYFLRFIQIGPTSGED